MTPTLKPLRWPRLWLALWCLAIAVVWVLCLMPSPQMPPLPSGADKVEHFLAYFVLAAAAVQLFAQRRHLAWVGVGLLAMGVVIEAAQHLLTAHRLADPGDVIANALGVAAGLAIAATPLRNLLLRLEPARR